MSMSKISVVFPVFNEADNLKMLYQQVKQACNQSNIDYEMIFVDNGSTDNSLHLIKELRKEDKRIVYVSLSRNFGHQGALFAGMSYCAGDAVITMDADLQHPPSLIPRMIDLWRNGAEVVYTSKKNADLSIFLNFCVRSFYLIISRLSRLQLDFGQSDFRLLDRKVLNVILKMPEYHKFLRGQIQWVGFRQLGLTYSVEKRLSGKSKFSYSDLFLFALDGIFAFSRYPLHILTSVGLIVSIFSLGYICFISSIWILKIYGFSHLPLPSGWATLIVSVLFIGSLQLIAIGILGEYIGRIYDQTKCRPIYIVREESEKVNEQD